MTKKDFVLETVQQLLENPKRVLKGHGIKPVMLAEISKQPVLMSKLAQFLFSMKTAKKGALGLRKAKNFQIKAYRNFNEFNKLGRDDVANFAGSLVGNDGVEFNLDNNVVTYVFEPAAKAIDVDIQTTEDLKIAMHGGMCTGLRFNQAISREFRIPNVMYLVIMFGDSAILPREEKIAERKEAINKRAVDRATKTAAKAKAKMIKNKKKQIAMLNDKISASQNTASQLQIQRAQALQLQNQLGGPASQRIQALNRQAQQFNSKRTMNDPLQGIKLRKKDNDILALAKKYLRKGNKREALNVLQLSTNKKLHTLDVLAKPSMPQKMQSADDIIKRRRRDLSRKVKALKARMEQLNVDLALAPQQKVRSVKSMISKTGSALNDAKIRRRVYNAKTPVQMSSVYRQDLLNKVASDIASNMQQRLNLQTSINLALQNVPAGLQQRKQMAKDIQMQINNNVPVQTAVKQVVAAYQIPAQQMVKNVQNIYGKFGLKADGSIHYTPDDLLSVL